MTEVAHPPPAAPATRAADRPVELPDRRVFWQWVWSAVRPVVGWVLALAGAIALFVGWWGVSGETLTARQLPYLVSAGLAGIALFIMAGVFLATDDIRRQFNRIGELERKVDDLYALFAADLAAGPATASTALPQPSVGAAENPVALPAGSSYHRADCALVAGKAQASRVGAGDVRERSLTPCRVCSPPPPAG